MSTFLNRPIVKIFAILFIIAALFLFFQKDAQSATSFIGASNLIATNGGAPGAITPHASTADGDLLVFYHYSRATGGNETVTLPTGFTSVFNSVTANQGLVAVGWRIKQTGDTTFTATVTNHATGGTGETIVEWIETFQGTDTTSPITDYTASLSTWASSTNIGPISAPASATVTDGDMVVVFGGRFENVTGQTVLTGDNLTWTAQTLNNTTSGSDAAAVTQTGLNSSGSNQTVTAKTISTTGTAQAGAGRMFIIKKAPDTTAPTPNPMTFASTPANDSATQISMTASTATDATTPPVSYFFTLDNTNCGANAGTGGTSSTWQAGTSYSDSGLTANKCYGYTVKARDSVGTPNETTASSVSSAYTSANTPSTPTLGSPTTNTLSLTNSENSNPSANPTTNFAVQVVTTSPSDAVWLNKWVDATGNPSATAVWMSDATLDALVLQSLQSSTLYGVKVKARNQDTDETALSTEGQGTTSAPAPITTISNFVAGEPSNSTIAPAGSALVDSFGLQTSSGTDTATGATVTLASGTGARVATVAITNNGDTVTYCSASPSGDTATLTSCGIPVTTTNTQFKIKITAIAHTAMPAPPGGSYAVTGRVTAFTSTNAQAGTDSGSATVTIDNLSPAGTTGASAVAGNAQVTVSWTNPADSDFQKVIIYCKTSSITEAPTEGTDPSVDATACDGTARVKYSGSTSPQIFTGLTNSTTYFFRIYARDTNGNFTAIASTEQVSATPTLTTTTIGNGTNPSSVTLAPGATITDLDTFTLVTSTGSDTVTTATVTLLPAGAFNNIAQVDLTDNSNVARCTAVTNPASNTISFTTCTSNGGIPVTNSASTYKIRITPKTHANMPAVPGASYATTGTVTAFTSTNAQAGTDSGSATVTIDNLSPNGATSVSGSAGNANATINWISSNSSDFNTTNGSVIYRWASGTAGSEVPTEGSTPTAGDTNGTATVTCVISSSSSTALSKIDGTGGSTGCTTTALTNGQDYTYKAFQKDSNGNYDAGVAIGTFTPSPTPTTTLGTGSDPSANTIAPGASATDVNQFTLQTNTSTETVTSITVDLSTASGIGLLAITNSSNTVLGSTTSPTTGSNIISVSSMSAGTSATTFKVRVTPLAHTSMPAVPGASYSITAPVTAWAGSFAHTGSDTNSNALTIDNLSPANASSVSGSAGNTQVTINWTNPVDSDYSSQVVLRRASSAVADVPVEGTTYTAGNTIGTATVACVISTPTATCTDTSLTNGTAYHYKIFSKDSNGNYSTGIVPTGSPFTPSLSTFTITSTTGSNGTISPLGVTNVAQGSSQLYTITPSLGYDVSTLVVDGSSIATSTTYTFGNVQQNHTIAVTFVQVTPTYTITSTTGANGTISPLGSTVLLQGASQTYTITPTSGYVVGALTVDSVSIATSTSHTFSNITANHTISVTFSLIPTPPGTFAITASAGTGGTISPSGVTAVTQGNSQTYTITPNSGYDLSTLTVDSVSVATSTSYTFTNVQAIHTISATFIALPAGATTPDTGASRPTTITFSGKAFPKGLISVIDKQLNIEKLLELGEVSSDDGSFSISFVGVLQALHSFALLAKDKVGRPSQSKFFFVDTISDSLVVKDLLLPPTIEMESRQVTRGDKAVIVGSATPGYIIHVELDGILIQDMQVGADGAYKFEVPTGVVEFGSHSVRVKQTDPITEKTSDSSTSRTFTVSRLIVVEADLNSDNKIDIRDWSIFLSLWGSKNATGRDRVDFNKDGKVDISDFSIFIKTIRKK